MLRMPTKTNILNLIFALHRIHFIVLMLCSGVLLTTVTPFSSWFQAGIQFLSFPASEISRNTNGEGKIVGAKECIQKMAFPREQFESTRVMASNGKLAYDNYNN